MRIGMVMKILWRRHWWEVCLFLAISLCLSALVWSRSGDRFLQGLVWLEVVGSVWLVTRVSLIQLGFETFGGWKARPVGMAWYVLGEVLFIVLVISLAGLARLIVVGEVLHPSADGWEEVMNEIMTMSQWLAVVLVICKVIGFGWELNREKSRPNLAWGLVIAMVGFSSLPVLYWGEARSGHIEMRGTFMMSPLGLDGVEEWQWLSADSSSFVGVDPKRVVKLPLRKGAMIERDGLRMEIMEIGVRGEEVTVEWQASRSVDFGQELPMWYGVMISDAGKYFGTTRQSKREEDNLRVPLLNWRRASYSSMMRSPLELPENELTGGELLEGAEFWITLGTRETPRIERDFNRDTPENSEEILRWTLMDGYDGIEVDSVREQLIVRGAEAMNEVLRAAPWSAEGWENIVKPYLLKFSTENDRERLLGLFETSPQMADFFLEKGWGAWAESILRDHLADGKTLTKKSVIEMAKLNEEKMGPCLANQLLRMSGDIDDVTKAVKGHPGVNWDEVRREAWRRVVTGFGSHHVWVKWGAELGEKEALRRLLVKAAEGKKWEREVLEDWFGKGNVVKELRDKWEQVEFEEGKWMIGGA